MAAQITALNRPTTDQALIAEMVETLECLLTEARAGELRGLIVVSVSNGDLFRIQKRGPMRRVEMAGYLSQALHDCLSEE